jgi:hypothetical protein
VLRRTIRDDVIVEHWDGRCCIARSRRFRALEHLAAQRTRASSAKAVATRRVWDASTPSS